MNRRACLAWGAGVAMAQPVATSAMDGRDAPPVPTVMDWPTFRRRFVTGEGRVVDTGNGGISHSEGQGYAMLLAVAHDDRTTFRTLWGWTRAELGVRSDGLHAWKWTPEPGPEGHLPDRNNATDGDLLIAWALLRAARRWRERAYAAVAETLARRIRTDLVVHHGAGAVLLPGADGFRRDGQTVVNLSYWIFPALRELQAVDPDSAWPQLEASGGQLLRTARFGTWGLPPDWLALVPEPVPAPGFAPVFGFNAVRIPLYLLWAGLRDRDLLEPFDRFWQAHAPGPPATVDLTSGALSSYPASPGVIAIGRLVRAALEPAPITLPEPTGEIDYYAAVLLLLVRLAAEEGPFP